MITIEKCSEVLTSLIDEASERFKPLLKVDDLLRRKMINIAKRANLFIIMYPVIYFDVRVDEDTTDITISIACRELTTDQGNDPFYDIMSNAKNFTIGKVKDDVIGMTFIFDGVWNPA